MENDYTIEIDNINYSIDINKNKYTLEVNKEPDIAIELNKQGPPGSSGNGIDNIEVIEETQSYTKYRVVYTDQEAGYYDYIVYNGEKGDKGDKGDPGTTDYNELENKPIFSTGLTDNNNTITVTDYNKLVKNTAISTGGLSILGTATTSNGAINIGRNSEATGAPSGIAIGNGAKVKTSNSIQLGYGTINGFTGLQVYSYPLLDGATGKIPAERTKTFVFEQGIPAKDWVVVHNLGKRPSITTTYTNGQEFKAFREYPDDNTVIIRNDNICSGYVYLN